MKRFGHCTDDGLGWVITKILKHFMSVNRYSPLAASGYIKLPYNIQNKKVTVNIQKKR